MKDALIIFTITVLLALPVAGVFLAVLTENPWWLWLCLPIVLFLS